MATIVKTSSGTWKGTFGRVNRAVQTGFSYLFLVMGGLLLALILQLPDLLKGLFAGDQRAAEAMIGCAAGVGFCWLQWRYRYVVYPQLLRDLSRRT